MHQYRNRVMAKDIETEKQEEAALVKRNNEAPSFSSSVAGNRSQLIIERYIQLKNIDVQEYIEAERVLSVTIPIPILRKWYPGPNWKKDLAKVCFGEMRRINVKTMPNGNFKMNNFFSWAELTDEGLILDVIPKVLQYYRIGSGIPLSLIDFNVTNSFKSKFSHELYWEICKNDNPRSNFSFFLTPAEINKKYGTKYNVTNIQTEILQPVQIELKKLYDDGLSARFFTYKERREVVGKSKPIVGWEFKIYNESRNKRQDIKVQEAYQKIDSFLQENIAKYRLNILSQLRGFDGDKIILIWMRLEKFTMDDTSHIRDKVAYLCSVLTHYGITPHSVPKNATNEIQHPMLFEKEERDTGIGIRCWMESLNHINESSTASNDVKNLFNQVRFDSYTETEQGNILTLRMNPIVRNSIKVYFEQVFLDVLQRYFPANLILKYYVSE